MFENKVERYGFVICYSPFQVQSCPSVL